MSIGQPAEPGTHVEGFRDEISALSSKRDAFFGFFDGAQDEHEAFVRGAWDFSIHISGPANGLLSDPSRKVALEIGYGGGRLLAAAACHFTHAIGVDIHHEQSLVEAALAKQGISNITLHAADGSHFPVADASVNFVYSFIVFQHMDKLEVIEANLRECFRCLQPGGIAVLYFGRTSRLSHNTSSRLLLWLDALIERLPWSVSHRQVPARVNETNIVISARKARDMMRSVGFSCLRSGVSRRNVPDRGSQYGGQTYFVVRKPVGAS